MKDTISLINRMEDYAQLILDIFACEPANKFDDMFFKSGITFPF